MARIVVVQADRTLLQLLTYILEQQGHQVVGLVSLTDALSFLENNPCRLVVLDLGAGATPDQVREAVARLRAVADRVPILLLASDATAGLPPKDLGVDAALARPVDPGRFKLLVEELLSRGSPPVNTRDPANCF